MKIRTISYSIKQGLKGLWRNRVMSLASITSVASALMILGIVFMIILNVNSLAETAKGQFDSVQLYLTDELSTTQMDEIGKSIEKVEGVANISFLSKEAALNQMKEQWGENGSLLEGLEANPLPNSYIIKLTNIEYADKVVNQVKGLEGIEEVKYYKDIVDKLLKITDSIRLLGMAVIGVLIFISMFVIANTIKLTVIARHKEINIMKYVGATNWFIRWPFLVEGMVLGLVGSLVALIIVTIGYRGIFNLITQKLYVMFSAYMLPTSTMVNSLSVIFIVLGAGIGALGSIFSMRKFLRV